MPNAKKFKRWVTSEVLPTIRKHGLYVKDDLIAKRIFSECLSGKGGSVIAKGLNRDKIPAKRGYHWSTGTVIDMLRNEKYKGDALFQKTYTVYMLK